MPRRVDHGERRNEIAMAVWQIVAEQGMGAVTLRSIAARGGISVGRVQHYFPTREAIVLYGLQAMIDRAASGFHSSSRDVDPRSALTALLIHSIPRTDERRLGSKVWYAYVAESVASQAIADLLRETLTGLEGLVTAMVANIREPVGIRAGAHDDRAVARMLLAAADGLVYRVLVNQLSDREADETVRRLLDGVLGPAC